MRLPCTPQQKQTSQIQSMEFKKESITDGPGEENQMERPTPLELGTWNFTRALSRGRLDLTVRGNASRPQLRL